MPTFRCDRGHSWPGAGDSACPTCGSTRLTSIDRPVSDPTIDLTELPSTKPDDRTIGFDGISNDRPPTDATIDLPAPSSKTVASASEYTAMHIDLGEGVPVAEASDRTVAHAVNEPPKARSKDATDPGPVDPKTGLALKVIPGYQILGLLGRGGMGVVYKAKQQSLGRTVAIKMILGGGMAGAEHLARFRFEAESLASLQHPNIVQVYEVGECDGCPFFSLEYIEGSSLEDKVDGPQAPREAAAMVETLARAMHAAHSRGIIHRDLKPANVLLTSDGVPKITDFGLAKRMDQEDVGHTHTGAILGTPSYMAPEQAVGRTKTAGPQADVYSLGAILYDMLTGRPPFRGTTVLQTLQQVQSLEPVPPTRLQPQVAGDLETICLKALEKETSKRYASAGDLAEDLRRFQAGEPILARPTPWWERSWKWAKRHPAAASLWSTGIVSTIAILVLGGLFLDSQRRGALERAEHEKVIADAAVAREKQAREQAEREAMLRQSAEKNFLRARQAVDQLLSQVGQEQLAHIPQMEKVRRELLKKALEFYEQFREEKATDPGIRRESARAQQRVADILEMLGDHRGAEKAYVQALTQVQQLVSEDPAQLDFRRDLASVAGNFGNLLRDLKRTKEAENIYREVLEARKLLAAEQPDGPDHQLDLARIHLNLGAVLFVIGKGADAEPNLVEARKILEGLVRSDVDNPRYQVELSRCLNNLSTWRKNQGQTAAAENDLLAASRLLTGLVRDNPTNPEYRQELALLERNLGELLRDSQPKKAEANFRKSLQERLQLAKMYSSTPTYRQELAQSHGDLAVLLQATGRGAEADREYDEAFKIQNQLVADFPHLPEFRRRLAASWNNRGTILATQARWPEAEKAFTQAQNLFGKLAVEFPNVPEYPAEVAGTYLNLGTIWQATGKGQQAEAAYRDALQVRRELAEKNKTAVEHQKELGNVLLNLATLLQLQNQPKAAADHYKEAAEIFAGLAAKLPGEPDYRHQWALTLNNHGSLLRQINEVEGAEKILHQAQHVFAKLLTDAPDVSTYRLDAARSHNELAILQAGSKRFKEAEAAWREALALLQPLYRASPDRFEVLLQIGQLQGNLAILLTQANQVDKAFEQFKEAIQSLEPFDPKRPTELARELVKNHTNLARLQESLNKFAEAEKNWLRIVEVQETLVKAHPNQADLRLEAAGTLQELAQRLLQKENFQDARGFAKKAVDFLAPVTPVPAPLQASRLYLAAAHLGLKEIEPAKKLLQGAAGELDPSLLPHAAVLWAQCAKLDAKNAEAHAKQAIGLLEKAVAAGFNEEAFLRTSPEFAAIRDRAEFQTLLKSIRK